MGGHDAVSLGPSTIRGDGDSTDALPTLKNLPQAPVETPTGAVSPMPLGLGQSCPQPVVPEIHRSR